MKLGTIIGRVTLSQTVPALRGARWMIVAPFSRDDFHHGMNPPPGPGKEPALVVYDTLGGGEGQVVGYIEGHDAAQAFLDPIPIDAVNAALVDQMLYQPFP